MNQLELWDMSHFAGVSPRIMSSPSDPSIIGSRGRTPTSFANGLTKISERASCVVPP